MGSFNRADNPQVSLSDDDGRAFVGRYSRNPKYTAWDKVMVVISGLDGGETLEGPYFIETVIPPDKYTICDVNGNSAKDGMVIRERQLREK